MYRLFTMVADGRLYEMSGRGWVRGNGTNFGSLQQVRGFVDGRTIPILPDTVDAYIGQVDLDGMIIETHLVMEDCNEGNS